MNYLTDERRHALSAEYVLGTLRGRARSRFEQLQLQFPQIRETREQWEFHINGLGEHLQPVAPDEQVWQRIVQRLDHQTLDSLPQNVVPMKTSTSWSKGVAALASAAALILAVLFYQQSTLELPQAQQFSVVQNEQDKPLWLIEVFSDMISTRATAQVEAKTANDYELWMVPKGGQAPISLGLLPQSGVAQLAKIAQFEQLEIAALAVSLEPLGGSPTGSPSEVLYLANLAIL